MCNMEKKIVVFGTGEIASKLTFEFMEKNISVDFYLDSLLSKNEFMNRPVFSLDYLDKLYDVNEYEYYLGTYTSSLGMIGELKKHGVTEENIHETKDYCVNTLENDIKKINDTTTFVLYPKFETQQKIESVFEEIRKCFPRCVSQKIRFLVSGNVKYDSDLNIKVYDEIEKKSDYVILVWDRQHLKDNILKQFNNQTLCIDREYFDIADIRLFLRFNKLLWSDFEKYEIENISEKNYLKLENENFKSAYVFGNGASCSEGIKKIQYDKSLRIVCNGMIAFKEYVYKVNPQIYVIADEVFAGDKYSEMLESIVDYVNANDCYLCISANMVYAIIDRYPKVKNKIITIWLDSKEINFPYAKERSVLRKSFNVMTSMVIPIASALSDNIFIAGCDGYLLKDNVEEWKYDEKLQKSAELNRKIGQMEWEKENYKKHIKYFEEIIKFGEKKGKNYESISFSNIPILKEHTRKL